MTALEKLMAVALVVGLSVNLQGCGSGGGDDNGTTTTTTTIALGNTISGIASRDTHLSDLVSALSKADLVDTLAGTGPFTVFAPTNEAFGKVPNATLTYLLANSNTTPLTQVLKYHVVSGDFPSTKLSNGENIKTLEGLDVTVDIAGSTVKINDATVTEPNVQASNGVVHVIDSVLIPSNLYLPTIPVLAAGDSDLGTLVKALEAADLVATLEAAGPFTVFAPTNKAFAALPANILTALLKPENKKQLVDVLTYHVASGEVLSTDLSNGEQITTLGGHKVNITIDGTSVKVNSASVTQANVLAINGVVHIIDAVLIPPGFVPPMVEKSQMIQV
jgi:uncharacterized surface protein with fasciclin (FAS1) repeats